MARPKPFQVATIEAVVSSFQRKNSSRRFLVADEVGLGKTVVAQGVVKRLVEENGTKPLVVLYVSSSLAIAAQNKRKLLEIVPKEERAQALCSVDRLTLVGTDSPPTHPRFHLYTLTPDTSIPTGDGRTRTGKQAERALIYALLKTRYPRLAKMFGQDTFRNKQYPTLREDQIWRSFVHYSKEIARTNRGLWPEFQAHIRDEFGVRDGQKLPNALSQFKAKPREMISKLRCALAAANLSRLEPDLVIFDEFQKFREVITPPPEIAESKVGKLLRGEEMEEGPALLLLSATPYKAYARRWEDSNAGSSRTEFFKLIDFLYGSNGVAKRNREKCEVAFAEMEKQIRQGQFASPEFTAAKANIEAILRPVMSRTERFAHEDGSNGVHIKKVRTSLHARDLRVFTHLVQSFQNDTCAIPYWTSVPLPAQTLGKGYVAWRRRTLVSADHVQHLTESDRKRFLAPKGWPHPSLRQLQSLVTNERLVNPWLSPSFPWWKLEGRWKAPQNGLEPDNKLLVFSRFRAVPQTLAALLSYGLECHFLANQPLDYETVTKRSVLQPRANREALLALFYPSPWLMFATEPLTVAGSAHAAIVKELSRQIRESLDTKGIRIDGETKRPLWQVLVRIEESLGVWRYGYNAWKDIASRQSTDVDADTAFKVLIENLNQQAQQKITTISKHELIRLAEFALTAPGVVIGRAIIRHWREKKDPSSVTEQTKSALEVSWKGLRNYLDQPWFVKALGGDERGYPDSVRRAIYESNFESLLDEHIWLMKTLQSLEGAEIGKELLAGLAIRSSNSYIHSIEELDKKFTLRCHVALPFTESHVKEVAGQTEEKPLRPDELRKAFNSPFWPYVLTTTSIGQEGLDFHCWCDSLVHWDLAHDPVSHEQRQGRIQRYAALQIRRRVAENVQISLPNTVGDRKSPWQLLAAAAESKLADDSGLKPWWIMPGAEIKNVLISVPTSEENERFAWLKQQVLLYRLTLGHPNQEDLLEVLKKDSDVSSPQQVRGACLQLSPFFKPNLAKSSSA